jgi:hypothetical protein
LLLLLSPNYNITTNNLLSAMDDVGASCLCHFPGNTWFEDWLQYMSNTHLFFGIFFHHKLHPVTRRERCVILLGSAAVGSLISNLIYLWFLHANFGMNDLVFNLPGNVDVTKLMITLWTLGCVLYIPYSI